MIYQWVARNRDHVGKHGIEPRDAQHVVEHARRPFPRAIEDEKHLVWGQTDRGRYIQVIFVYLSDEDVDFESLTPVERLRFESGEDVAMIIHARNMTDDQKKQFRRIMKR